MKRGVDHVFRDAFRDAPELSLSVTVFRDAGQVQFSMMLSMTFSVTTQFSLCVKLTKITTNIEYLNIQYLIIIRDKSGRSLSWSSAESECFTAGT